MTPYINPSFRERQLSTQPQPVKAAARGIWPALCILWGVAGLTVGLAIGRVLWF